MVELNLEEQVQAIEQATGMRSESLQSPEEQQAVLNTMAASGAVYDHKTVGIPMPNLITIDAPVELQSGQPVYF